MKLGGAAATLVAMLAIAGCSAPIETPAPIDEKALVQSSLDATWEATGLEGTAERPDVPVSEPVEAEAFYGAITGCLAVQGVELQGLQGDGNAYTPTFGEATSPTRSMLAWYECFATYPPDSREFGTMTWSDDQTAYLVDYWKRWMLPCISMNGHTVVMPGTDSASLVGWSPYQAITDITDYQEVMDLTLECGPAYGVLDGGS